MLFLENKLKLSDKKTISLSGLTDELLCVYLKKLVTTNHKSVVILTSGIYESNQIYQSMKKHYDETYFFPMDDFINSEALALSPDLKLSRVATLNAISEKGNNKIVVTNLMGYLRFLPEKQLWNQKKIVLTKGAKITKEELLKQLIELGYVVETLVNKTGEVGNRGFVLDIYPIGYEVPIRIEFWGDEIDSIRCFDPDTQLSTKAVDQCVIQPITEFLVETNMNIEDDSQKYLPNYSKNITNINGFLDDVVVVYVDYNQIKNANLQLNHEMVDYNQTHNKQDAYMFALEEIKSAQEIFYLKTDNLLADINIVDAQEYNAKELAIYQGDIEKIRSEITTYIHVGKTVVICLEDQDQVQSTTKMLELKTVLTNEFDIQENKINVLIKSLSRGFVFGNYVVITPNELFKRNQTKNYYKNNMKYGLKIKDVNKLTVGDYVVHYVHGIGIYQGITTLVKNGFEKDYLVVQYKDNGKLYIPVEKIELIQKYAAGEGGIPKVNALGSSEWQKTKFRARERIKDIAMKLLKIYAEREAIGGYPFEKDSEEQFEFESKFKYEPTIDQITVSEQIKRDMESPYPMDILLCGDVGYGKTEVAFRAIFKAIHSGKQVAYLCPTTILANQHYENAVVRFRDFAINVALLNRFVSKKQVNQILKEVKEGKVDLLIGTHRLLSNDVKFKDLGLLVVDEEQRFGVTHKEKIKELKKNIDVLTLSATPIPRTLQMAMSGLRKLCLIETPPVNRYPVQTYVLEENDYIVKDAIYKEISRGGQVFILYNKIEDIAEKTRHIQQLVGEARVTYAHGQMNKNDMENKMLGFINGDYDVLVSTTIIETGIDIPNANTLIILNADRFGLSQLYQIRGRVGRSNKIAYAYLMYKKEKQLSEIASKRLNAIKEFTELGSGFFIAMRDLSLRGAGDILGSEQAGFIDTVGIDLYVKMLHEEVAKIKGEEIKEEITDEKPLIDVTTHIEDQYVVEEELKIEIHRKINEIDGYEKLLEVEKELEDRFGKVSETLKIYMYAEWFEKTAKQIGIMEVNQVKNYIELIFDSEWSSKIEVNDLFMEANKISRMFRIGYQHKKIKLILDTIKLEKNAIYYLAEISQKLKDKYIS